MGKTLHRWWHGREEIVAIDVQNSCIIVASAALQPSSPHQVRIIPLEDRRPLATSSADVELVSYLLRQHLIDTDFRSAQLGVCLPSHSTFIGHHPDLFLRPFCDFERVQGWMSHSLSLSREEHRICIVPYPAGELNERCLVAAVKRQVVDFWESIAESLGSDLVLVSPRACALHRYGCDATKTKNPKVSLWIDTTENPPYGHIFDSATLLGSFQIGDLMGVQGGAQRAGCEVSHLHSAGLNQGEGLMWCVFREGENISEVVRSLGCSSWHVEQIREIPDETIAARGTLLMLEDLQRED